MRSDRKKIIICLNPCQSDFSHSFLNSFLSIFGLYHLSKSIFPIIKYYSGIGSVINAFIEKIYILPTVLGLLDLDIPLKCDGHSLKTFLCGKNPLAISTPAACKKNYLLSNSIRIEPVDRKMKCFLVFQEFQYRMMWPLFVQAPFH